jgi:deoxyhypusine synthase
MDVEGFRISKNTPVSQLAAQMSLAGFSATELGRGVQVIRAMKKDKALVILAFTSNMISSGLRETIAELCRKKFVDVIVTGIGSVEEDIIKIRMPFLLSEFRQDDAALHRDGINRIGNILVPNDRYEFLEKVAFEFYGEIFERFKERRPNGKFRAVISPSGLVRELGLFAQKKFNKNKKEKKALERSWVFWAAKNNISVVLPAPVDGALGLQLAFFRQDRDLVIDVADDLRKVGAMVNSAKKVGGIILGGGFAKHHAIALNILRGGLDYAVYVSTGTQHDGSMTGARVNEAVSWGKVSSKARTAYVEGDATVIFPIMIAPFL